ncbi:MAG: hypothetical protein HZA90_01935 [Verrucomicrobia bacterium]|nr:hypothetical protein [Verrucomicrobiota bacterium]
MPEADTTVPGDTGPVGRSILRALLVPAAAGLALRLAALVQLLATPFGGVLVVDHAYYLDWARAIAGGAIVGGDVFEMDPGYAYLLALLVRLAGESLVPMRLLSVAAGTATIVVVGFVAWHTFELGAAMRRRVAQGAAWLCALCPVLVYYDVQVSKTGFAILGLAALVLVAQRARADPRPWGAAAVGFLLALVTVFRANALVLSPLVAAQVAARLPLRTAAARLLLLVAGAAPVFGLALAHNVLAGGQFVLLTSEGGEVFYLGTLREGHGEYLRLPFVRPHPWKEHEDFRAEARRRTGIDLDRAASSRFWWREGWAQVKSDPAGWMGLVGRRAWLLVHAFEIPDNQSLPFLSAHVGVLAWLKPFGAYLLFPLGLAGLVFLRRGEVRAFPAAMGALYLGVFLLFFVNGRFRSPVVPLFAVYAAGGVALALQAARSVYERRVLGPYLGVLALALVVVNLPREIDHGREEATQLHNHGIAWRTAGRRVLAEDLLARAAAHDAEVEHSLAYALVVAEGGRVGAAIDLVRSQLGRHPGHPRATELVIELLALGGRVDEARSMLDSARAVLAPETVRRLEGVLSRPPQWLEK